MKFDWRIIELKKYYKKYNGLDNAVKHMIKDGIIDSFEDIGSMTLEETGYVLGITRERVRQIEANAMRKIKANIARNEKLRNAFTEYSY